MNSDFSLFTGITDMQCPACPECHFEFTYVDRGIHICPECAHEWDNGKPEEDNEANVVRDANGNILTDGDTITIIKDLKVKGSSSSLKIGTRVKGIRLVEGDHNIDCRIEGFGSMKLKSEFVRKN
ncbi:alkylphosphonate utilization operon protein PhnA (plasmid) [Pantoea sp. At-9b]|nr:alkylphosphonate utilization operon protein PhnA [Pantoea sp. At-9b]